jgi:hypothetical protein
VQLNLYLNRILVISLLLIFTQSCASSAPELPPIEKDTQIEKGGETNKSNGNEK